MTIIQLLQLLRLSFVMSTFSEFKSLTLAKEKKTTCGIRRLETFDMMLTCYFHDSMSALRKDFTVYLYNEKQPSPKLVVSCEWLPEIVCHEARGYKYEYDINVHHDHTNVRILNTNAEYDGMYTCQVIGESDPGTCSLTDEQYPRFLLNSVSNETVTASEDSTVDMLCLSDTWTSTSIISVVDGDRLLASRHSNETQSGRLRYVINKARCEDTGDYRCEFTNTLGLYTETVRLLVHCGPRQKRDKVHPPFVVIRDNNGHLSLNMTAYPMPHVEAYYKLKPDSIEIIEDRIPTTCAAESAKTASVICNISVINVTNADVDAQFMVVFNNGLGELPFTFRIKLNRHTLF